jgi:hypothetical protein
MTVYEPVSQGVRRVNEVRDETHRLSGAIVADDECEGRVKLYRLTTCIIKGPDTTTKRSESDLQSKPRTCPRIESLSILAAIDRQ